MLVLHSISLAFVALSSWSPIVSAQDGYANVGSPTTGGAGGTTTTVTSAAAFTSAVAGNAKKTVFLNGSISLSSQAKVGSNTSIIGVGSTGKIIGGGLSIQSVSNIIVRNIQISKVVGNDAITLKYATHVWIDHNEFFSDLTHGVDYYDGQVDITRACDYITVSWNYFHDHYKSSLVGHAPNNAAEDTDKFHLTYHHNYWRNVHTRTPATRYAHAHVYNNLYDSVVSQGIHSRSLAQVFIEGNVFANTPEPVSTYGFVIPDDSPENPSGDYEQDGYANFGSSNDFGAGINNITRTGSFTSIPYTYSLTPLSSVRSVVTAGVGIGKI